MQKSKCHKNLKSRVIGREEKSAKNTLNWTKNLQFIITTPKACPQRKQSSRWKLQKSHCHILIGDILIFKKK